MLLERLGETVTLELADGTASEVAHVLCLEADVSDQSVMDVQTRFINQARYKGDNVTLTVWWPKSAPHDLMDAHLVIRGERYRVYGSPFNVANSPNGYDARLTCMRSLYLYTAELGTSTQERDQWGVWHEAFEWVETPVNLLRLSDTVEDLARASELARVVLIELPPGTSVDGVTRFRFGGREHVVTSVDYGGETVVVGGSREVD